MKICLKKKRKRNVKMCFTLRKILVNRQINGLILQKNNVAADDDDDDENYGVN